MAAGVQVVILAGGLGTRLRPLTNYLPKALVPVNGKPFVDYQLELLRKNGIEDVVLCTGHLGEMIAAHLGDGRRLGMRIQYSQEEEGQLLGTAGAIKKAEPLLADEFLLLYGDSYLMVDYPAVMAYFRGQDKLGLMVVYENHNRYDRSNIIVQDGLVTVYDKTGATPGMTYINYGLSALRREALRLVPAGVPYSQEELYQSLIQRGELLAYETSQRFYEVGSPAGLAEFRRCLAQREVPR